MFYNLFICTVRFQSEDISHVCFKVPQSLSQNLYIEQNWQYKMWFTLVTVILFLWFYLYSWSVLTLLGGKLIEGYIHLKQFLMEWVKWIFQEIGEEYKREVLKLSRWIRESKS